MIVQQLQNAYFLFQQGRLHEAADAFYRIHRNNPRNIDALNLLGMTCRSLGAFPDATKYLKKCLKIKPDFAQAHSNLGDALIELGELKEALVSLRRAVALDPNLAEAHSHLGYALHGLGRPDEAMDSYRRALGINPTLVGTHNHLGYSLLKLARHAEAEACFRRALELDERFAPAYNNLGTTLSAKLRLAEAEACFNRALELDPQFLGSYSGLLFGYGYDGASARARSLERARQCGAMLSARVDNRYAAWKVTAAPERLRVGFVSGDLRTHPVGFFLENVLANIDPARIELLAYPTISTEDELTDRIRSRFSSWRPIVGKSEQEAAKMIHADGVHVLIDLSGHTDYNRLPVFAWKPAPVQASWLGYFSTTGVAEIDFVLADEVGVPEAGRADFTERVWYLPDTRLCFSAPRTDRPVAPLPALSSGQLTFGCFQSPAKIGDDVLAAWARVLSALPSARLRLQGKPYADPALKECLAERLVQVGIEASRFTIHEGVAHEQYLAAHDEVDLVLDTFPYPGGTTTCEALWMGVPTLTLAGETLLARQGASLLSAAGLPDWIANDEAEYVDKAVAMASDLSRLAALRAGLRQQVLASPLFDAPRFARNLEGALWGMWGARAGN